MTPLATSLQNTKTPKPPINHPRNLHHKNNANRKKKTIYGFPDKGDGSGSDDDDYWDMGKKLVVNQPRVQKTYWIVFFFFEQKWLYIKRKCNYALNQHRTQQTIQTSSMKKIVFVVCAYSGHTFLKERENFRERDILWQPMWHTCVEAKDI